MNLFPTHFHGHVRQVCRARRARAGMVLFEVIIALTIFTVAAFALVMALHSAFDAAMDRNEIDVAIRGLENQLALLHSARVTPGDTDLPDDGTGVGYHVTIAQQQMQDQKKQPVPNMYLATITATWKSHGDQQQRSVTELIYQP